jgi:hypothetical protein
MVGRGLLVSEWVDDDEVTVTYRTLKQMARESAEAERTKIVEELNSRFFLHLSHHSTAAPADEMWNNGFQHALKIVARDSAP